LDKNGIPAKRVYDLTQKCKGVFDVRQIRVGHEYHTYFSKDSVPSLHYLVYERDAHSFVVFGLKDTLSVTIHEKEIETSLHYAEVTINSSLWVDLQKAGVSPLLALALSDIYAWSIDFFGLQKGDSFKALYEVMSYKGDVLDIGNVKYAEFVHAGKSYQAYHYELENQSNEYWNEKGESMRKAFLKAPLNYKRISSGFTYARKHPVTRKVQPHTGVDYAAPTGTPVVSIGDGVVVEKGYKGAGGNTVKIKHNSVYTSAYLHLSKYGKGIAVGTRVKQGQVIGYVGSTGRSTGPHLDFRVWKNGTPINPLTMKMPPAVPVPKDKMGDFETAKEQTHKAIVHFTAMEYFNKSVKVLVEE
jgi:murein DD-endopeptidase MepM/ murein hydrolase activator NlpD